MAVQVGDKTDPSLDQRPVYQVLEVWDKACVLAAPVLCSGQQLHFPLLAAPRVPPSFSIVCPPLQRAPRPCPNYSDSSCGAFDQPLKLAALAFFEQLAPLQSASEA